MRKKPPLRSVMPMANVKWIDATIWCGENDGFVGETDLRKYCDECFERYAYGREVAPTTGRRHLQFRGVLRAPLDAPTLDALSVLGFRNVTPTHVRNFDYVYKDKDFYVSWEVYRSEFDRLKKDGYEDWMVQMESMEDELGRTIEIVLDEDGKHWKTAWAMLMAYEHKALYCPPFAKGNDLVNFVLQARSSDWYILDMPRAFEFTKDWACAIEQLKNGYVYDTRYSFKDKMLPTRPRVTLLVNTLPDYETYFSADRVLPFRITPQGYLWSV